MKYECNLIQDLLPLYQDDVCSETSKEIVRGHLKECSRCRDMAGRLQDFEVDKKLTEEKNSVLMAHEKKERRKTYTVGMITAGILMIPIIVCLICNLAVGHSLDWFFLVLASLLVFASLTVLPLLVLENRWFWTILGFSASLLVLLFVCCVYVGGDWFFVASTACILGISVLFAPYIIKKLPLPEKAGRHGGLIAMLWDTLWLYLLIVVCGFLVDGGSFYWRMSLSAVSYGLLFPWVIFMIVRYLKCNCLLKTGIAVAIEGTLFAFCNDLLHMVSGETVAYSIFNADLRKGFEHGNWEVLNANIYLTILIVSVAVGIVLCILGILSANGKKKNKQEGLCGIIGNNPEDSKQSQEK